MPYIDAGESRIYYESHGEGTPVLFAHGVGGNHASWHKQVPDFMRDHRVILFDHRAFGNSSDVEEAGQSRYVEDMLCLLDALEIDRVILIGQSMGGGTCANFTCAHPERVEKLVIADSLIGIDAPEPLAAMVGETLDRVWNLSQAERVLGPVMRDDDPASTLLYLQIASFNAVTIRTLKGSMPRWTPDRLAATGVPTLFLVGEHDVLFPPENVRMAQAMVAGASFALIEGAGHSAYFERPLAFNRHVRAFLSAGEG